MPIFTEYDRAPTDSRPLWRQPKMLARIAAAVGIVAAILFLATPQFQFSTVPFEPGKPMDRTVIARFPFEVRDQEREELRRKEAERAVGQVYRFRPDVPPAITADLKTIVNLTNAFEKERVNPGEARDYGVLSERIRQSTGIPIGAPTLQVLSGEIRSARFFEQMAAMYRQLYSDWVVVEGWFENDLAAGRVRIPAETGQEPSVKSLTPANTLVHYAEVRTALEDRYLRSFYPLVDTGPEDPASAALLRLTLSLTRPNLVLDPEASEQAKTDAIAAVEPQYRPYAKGDIIINRGAVPNRLQADALDQYNVRVHSYRFMRLVAAAVLILAMALFVALYARRFRPLLRFRTSTIVIFGIPFLTVLVIGRAATILLAERYSSAAGYLYPAALVGMLAVVLLDVEMGIILVVVGSVLVGLATDMNYQCAAAALFGGLAAVIALYGMRQRSQLFVTAIAVAAVNSLTIGLLRFIADPTVLYYQAAIWGTLSAGLSYFLAIGSFPLFEGLFGVTTVIKLLELTGVHHPLLREVEEKAPGTYQHSLNVAKLAEAAAEAVGANYLLVRAGAYFHDVGKVLKPRYFSENQISTEERRTHEKLSPYMSCLVIRNHVKEGIEIARRFGLPEKVIDFIPQHHGTTLIKYFYHEAIKQYEESESAEPVRMEDFRYPGPKPQTVEAAIVMLADSVEATATSRLTRPRIDVDDIRKVVNDTVQDKFADGQFDECHLTLRQLHEIRESMVRTLIGRFHHRIDYPSPVPTKKPARESAAAQSSEFTLQCDLSAH